MPGVFISYRREDASAYAGRLYDHVSARFGAERVFMDIDTIRPGDDFVQVISDRVAACDSLIAVIGKNWLSCRDSNGRRRLDNPNDYVRIEIASALQRNVRVIPALFDGAAMPSASDLPPDLAPLARRNAIEISNTLFRPSVERLIQTLEETVRPSPLSFQRLLKVKPEAAGESKPKTGRTIVPALRMPSSMPASLGPMLGAGAAFFFLQTALLSGMEASYRASIYTGLFLHSVALFLLLSVPILGGALDRMSVVKLAGCWFGANLLKIFAGSVLIAPWPIPPYMLRYSMPAGSSLILVIVEAGAALLFGALVRFIRPAVPWKTVFTLAQVWGAGRLLVWLISYASGRGFASIPVWALYDAAVGASTLWLIRQFRPGPARPVT